MSDPFFAATNRGQKRKRTRDVPTKSTGKRIARPEVVKRKKRVEDEIEDEEGPGLESEDAASYDEYDDRLAEEEDAGETAAQKRLRLARLYLDNLASKRSKDQEGFDAATIDRDYIEQRLQQEVLASTGKFHIQVASKIARPSASDCCYAVSAHRLTVTSAIASEDASNLYTASKDGSIARWDLYSALNLHPESERRRIPLTKVAKKYILPGPHSKKHRPDSKEYDKNNPAGHSGEILTLALSEDGRTLASAGTDKMLGVWSTEHHQLQWRKGLKSHKDTIASVKFRKGTTQCYTSSYDRTLKIFDVNSLTYIDTLFGHQEKIVDLSVLKSEVAVTAGGSDKSVRYWKIADESQLVFRGGGTGSSRLREVIEGSRGADDVADLEDEDDVTTKRKQQQRKLYVEGSIECVAMIDDTHFLSGGNSGNVSLWSTSKKKPIFTWPVAHGLQSSESGPAIQNPRWITSIACLPYADLFVTGSWDGQIQFWAIDPSLKSFKKLWGIPAAGVVNSLQLILAEEKPGLNTKAYLVAALGQEHKLGRWVRLGKAKNQALVVQLKGRLP